MNKMFILLTLDTSLECTYNKLCAYLYLVNKLQPVFN